MDSNGAAAPSPRFSEETRRGRRVPITDRFLLGRSMDSLLLDTFVYLVAAVIAVPVAKRFGMGSVLGYLLAGALIGPQVLNLVGDRAGHVMHFAEFGVVMMLFLVGLELQPSRLWEMRVKLVGLGGLQILATAFAI